MFSDGLVTTTVSLIGIFPEKGKQFTIGGSEYNFVVEKVTANPGRKTECVIVARGSTTHMEFQTMLRKQREAYKMVMPFEPLSSDELKEFKNTYLAEGKYALN